MKNFYKNSTNIITDYIFSLHRYSKRTIAILTDISLCILCTWVAFVLRFEEFILLRNFNINSAVLSVVIAIPLFWFFGLYRTLYRFTGLSIIFNILASTFIYGLIYFLIISVYGIEMVSKFGNHIPRSIGIIQPMLLFFSILSSRLFVKYLLAASSNHQNNFYKKNVLIYGAGDAGRQLVVALENNSDFKVIGFLDDNAQLHRQVLLGQTIYSPHNLNKLIKSKKINLVFLALPSIDRNKRNKIIKQLNKYKIVVKTLPSISEIMNGRITLSDIKDLNIDDLLSRAQVEPDKILLNKNINNKTVLVTGAGGSIGSELCRQITDLNPIKLILLELNEYVLYKIYEELKIKNKNLKIIPLLTNAQNQNKLELIFEEFSVDTVYHAAAYKHVPLVEENICEGVKNNVFSTLSVAKACAIKKISNLVLISSDKAVRPTNIMGASKRLSELCVQGICKSALNKSTNFSIVRFGNVLESSGSVIPKFKKQIKDGGPVTLTHNEVTRYFMTVTEAAQLVIQAGAMGKKSEVFVLDMGESIKIKDLIIKMISLSGFTIKDRNNPDGDIEIKLIGLRPGEKKYEELLIGNNPQITEHPKIKMINDPSISFDHLEVYLFKLKEILDKNQATEVKNQLDKLIKAYKSNSKMVDHIYIQQNHNKNNKLKKI